MKFDDFWYIVALSKQLKPGKVLSRTILGEWLAIFRDQEGKPVVLRDRCMHRNSRLSRGKVNTGQIQCPYHGWVYDRNGEVISIPAEGDNFKALNCRVKSYPTREEDDYIYVKLSDHNQFNPFRIPHYRQPGWETVRVINRFHNNITNCVENFINIPHTVTVHPGIFRTPQKQKLKMTVERKNGSVFVEYLQETNNLGWYAKFLNPSSKEIKHTDSFYMPNITSVEYNLGKNRRLFITSQSIPETQDTTLVYTDVTYNYGIWNKMARPFIYWTAQHIISQDVEILNLQQEVIKQYGTPNFVHTPTDIIHVFVDSIINKLERGEDPSQLKNKTVNVSLWV
ncbi:MAG: aromatic ring-hydroxylating dioxygenase subunit alpha [Cyanobacteria bacterium J06592_8]